MRLLHYELKKIWGSRYVFLFMSLAFFLNLLLLFIITSPAKGVNSAHAYNIIIQKMCKMDEKGKSNFVYQELSRAQQVYQLANNIKAGLSLETALSLIGAQEWDEAEVRTALQPIYTNSLKNDYVFLKKISLELSVLNNYENLLDLIDKRANKLQSISIFSSDQNTYEKLSIIKYQKEYQKLHDLQITFYPQFGIYSATSSHLTDIVIIVWVFFLASLLRHEKDTQMLKYIHTLPNGRAKTALIKIIAINLSVFCSTILLYGSNLLYCKILYGLGPLCRSIQSVPAFNQSTLQITVGEYLILYLLIKSFVAIIIGDLVMLVIILPRTPYWGYLILLSLFLSQAIIHQIIPGSSKWNYLKYFNVISMLKVNDSIGAYQLVNCFGTPISVRTLHFIYGVIMLIITKFGFMIAFCRLNENTKESKNGHSKNKPYNLGITGYEFYKQLKMYGGFSVLFLYLVIQLYSAFSYTSEITLLEQYYKEYSTFLTGPITKETISSFQEKWTEIQPIIKIEWEYKNKIIDYQTYTELIRANLPLQYKYLALSRIKESLINGVKRPRTSILYESGWLHFLGIEEFDAQRESLLITILCVAGLSYGFFFVLSIGIQQYFATMPKGRRELWKGRKKFVDLFCLIIALESFLASFIQSLMCGGLHQGLAPVYSINVFSWMPELPLVFLFLLIFSSRFVAIRMLGGIIVLISSFVHKPITSLFLSFASLSFTLLLSYWEYPQMKWLSIFPMIDSGRIISQSNQWGGIIASSFICIASIYLCNYICEKEHMKAALS